MQVLEDNLVIPNDTKRVSGRLHHRVWCCLSSAPIAYILSSTNEVDCPMDRSNSTSSNASSKAASGPFAYQTRLLERTASKGGGGSLSRSSSQSGMGILANSINSIPSTSSITRKWTPSHRVAASLDATRGRWDERFRDLTGDGSPTIDSPRTPTLGTSHRDSPPPQSFERRSVTPPNLSTEPQRTPTYLKRRTMPAPIIATPLSPNSTGITVENDSPSLSNNSPTSHRIYMPLTTPFHTPSSSSASGSTPILSPTKHRSNTLDSTNRIDPSKEVINTPTYSPSHLSHDSFDSSTSAPIRRRPTSLYGSPYQAPPSPEKATRQSIYGPESSLLSTDNLSNNPRSPTSSSSSVMAPTVYRSSYMSSKRSSMYGDNLGSGRKLGRHLPRIASGDSEEPARIEKQDEDRISRQRDRERRLRNGHGDLSLSPRKPDLVSPTAPNAEDVAGLPGRIQLKAPSAPSSPLPSSRLTGGLWADKQRHLIQAYEYLCHVGEAQQWIEGCLGEELGFGVVEMEEGLRNGVVLAKLVRAFQGEGAVRKIYDVSISLSCVTAD